MSKLFFNGLLEAELSAYLGAERYEHLPWGRDEEQTRSGYYRRELITQYGRIADLRVPKLRSIHSFSLKLRNMKDGMGTNRMD
jgi:transposase-like protein